MKQKLTAKQTIQQALHTIMDDGEANACQCEGHQTKERRTKMKFARLTSRMINGEDSRYTIRLGKKGTGQSIGSCRYWHNSAISCEKADEWISAMEKRHNLIILPDYVGDGPTYRTTIAAHVAELAEQERERAEECVVAAAQEAGDLAFSEIEYAEAQAAIRKEEEEAREIDEAEAREAQLAEREAWRTRAIFDALRRELLAEQRAEQAVSGQPTSGLRGSRMSNIDPGDDF